MSKAVPSEANEKKDKETKADQHAEALNDHHDKAHHHLKAAHAAAGTAAARHHINQAGMALTALHRTAKTAMAAKGHMPTDSYDAASNGEYAGKG